MRAAGCAPRRAASREVRCSAKCCMRTTCRVLGSLLPAHPRPFGAGSPVCLRPPSTPPFDGVSSFRELSASFRVLRPATCSRAREPASASLGVPFPHRGFSFRRPPLRGNPDPRSRSALGVSHALDGFLRQKPLRVCFTPLPRPGFALQGIVPHRGAVRGFPRRVMPSCR